MFSAKRAYPTIPAADMKRAKRWYEEKLGLKPVSESEYGAKYDLGGGMGFMLYPTENAGKAPNTLMCFSSTDVESDVADLKKRGVKFEEYDLPGMKTVNSIATAGSMKGAWFRDSEGNILSVSSDPS
jgi:catechol 2,3-dioxygenase-like lactoylglutathione lyase family enzyme